MKDEKDNAIVENDLCKMRLGDKMISEDVEWVKGRGIIYKHFDIPDDIGLIYDRYSKNTLEFLGVVNLVTGEIKKSEQRDKYIELEDIGIFAENGSRVHPRAIFTDDGKVFVERSLLADRKYLEYISSKRFLDILVYWENSRKSRI